MTNDRRAMTEEGDRVRRRLMWKMPSGLYLLGSLADGHRNLMTLNWATQVADEPKLLAVSVQVSAVTHGLIEAGGVFSLNILKRADRSIVRKFVKPVDPKEVVVDASGTGAMRQVDVGSDVTGAPIVVDAVGWLDCEVRQKLPLGSHSLFVGEVVGFGFGEGGDEAEVLRMEDTRMNYGG